MAVANERCLDEERIIRTWTPRRLIHAYYVSNRERYGWVLTTLRQLFASTSSENASAAPGATGAGRGRGGVPSWYRGRLRPGARVSWAHVEDPLLSLTALGVGHDKRSGSVGGMAR